MSKPFVLVVLEDGEVNETIVVGVVDLEVIFVDFDDLQLETPEAAQDLIDQIEAKYEGTAVPPGHVNDILSRLNDVVEENADREDAYEPCYDEDDDEDDEGTSLPLSEFIAPPPAAA